MSTSASSRSGVLAGGNWLIDHVKVLDAWPPQDALANIVAETWGNGGAPYNVLKDLAKLGARFPLAGVGLVGEDADGERIVTDCRRHGIDTTQLRRTNAAPTSYSDVMTDGTTGRRTFFHQRGANALLAPEHFDFTAVRAKMFHLGYLLLLDGLDALDGDRPRASDVLRRARAAGLKTSLDCVSENRDRFQLIVAPVLREVDILFVNDFEAEKLTGIAMRRGERQTIDRAAVERTAQALRLRGVREWVIVHFPEGVYALSGDASGRWQPSVRLPAEMIKGTAGAGDALAAGVLYGLHEGWPVEKTLRLGVAAAAASLMDATCSEGIVGVDACEALAVAHGWRELPT
ncbi:MAG TPA: carbohydrate kinase family protein [Opitutus sp.]|nr:carbohydrate kinase family protein [Opitutus sp.]